MILLTHISLEQCECGATPVEESVAGWHVESRKFFCGRHVVLRGGNETNYSVEDYTKCPNSAEGKTKKKAIEDLLTTLLATCDEFDAHHTVPAVALEDVKSSIRNSLGWRLR